MELKYGIYLLYKNIMIICNSIRRHELEGSVSGVFYNAADYWHSYESTLLLYDSR